VKLEYTPLERVAVGRPVDRLVYIADVCTDRAVLDLGCLDETALSKQGTPHWLHAAIAAKAKCVIGLDNSALVPSNGLTTGPTSRVLPGDVMNLTSMPREAWNAEVIVAGELLEHLPRPLDFLHEIRASFRGNALVLSTPNATSVSNVGLAALGRESSHRDHLQLYSVKTLNTLAVRSGFARWSILPYYVRYTEMALRAGAVGRASILMIERLVNVVEWTFPLLAGGLILHVHEI